MNLIKHIIQFLLILALQVFVFNHIFFMGYMNPYIYVIFLLYLPVKIWRSGLLVVAFLLGLGVDLFENSGGIHASASLILAYLRPFILRIVSRRQESDLEDLKISSLALPNMFIYALYCILLHHFSLFLLESFSFQNLGSVLLRTLYSTIFTTIFVLIVQLWNYKKRHN